MTGTLVKRSRLRRSQTLWTQDITCIYIRRSEDVLGVLNDLRTCNFHFVSRGANKYFSAKIQADENNN